MLVLFTCGFSFADEISTSIPGPLSSCNQVSLAAVESDRGGDRPGRDQSSAQETDLKEWLETYRQCLLYDCNHYRQQVQIPGMQTGHSGGTDDLIQLFTQIQAMTRQQAIFVTQEQKKAGMAALNAMRGTGAGLGNTFTLHEANQLLRRNPEWGEEKRSNTDCTSTPNLAATTRPTYKYHDDDLVDSCLLISEAGSGKTMLCHMLLTEFTNSQETALTKTCRFPIYISCRDGRRMAAKDWLGMLKLQDPRLNFNECQSSAVMKYLLEHSKEVVFVIDGVDEISEANILSKLSGGVLSELVYKPRAAFENACVLITGRPCQLAADLVVECKRHYCLSGFTQTQLHEFCRRRLGDAMGAACMNELSMSGVEHVKHAAMSTPLIAALVCELYWNMKTTSKSGSMHTDTAGQVSAHVPRSMVELYCRFVIHLLSSATAQSEDTKALARGRGTLNQHAGLTGSSEKRPIKQIQDGFSQMLSKRTNSKTICALDELSHVAKKQLLEKSFSFPASELSEECLQITIKLGILYYVSGELDDGAQCADVSFIHVTFQEFFGARSVAARAKRTSAEVKKFMESIGCGQQTWPFWQFVCGLVSTDHLTDVITKVMCHSEKSLPLRRTVNLYLMRCIMEHQTSVSGNGTDKSGTSKVHPGLAQAANVVCSGLSDCLDLGGSEFSEGDLRALECVTDLVRTISDVNLSGSAFSCETLQRLAPLLCCSVTLYLDWVDLHGPLIHILAKCLQSPDCHVQTVVVDVAVACLVKVMHLLCVSW